MLLSRFSTTRPCFQHKPAARTLFVTRASLPNQPSSHKRSGSPAEIVAENSGALSSALDSAQQHLGEYCSRFPDQDSAGHCWEVYQDLERKRRQAETACAVQLNASGRLEGDCSEFEHLARLAWDLEYSGAGEDALYKVLSANFNLEHRPPSPEGEQVRHSPEVERLEALQRHAMEVFAANDNNGDGYLDREEFLSAMDMLEEHMELEDMAQVFEALDVHGRISREQFVDAAVAEGLSAAVLDRGSDAAFLRHVHAGRPAWWTSSPGMLSNMA